MTLASRRVLRPWVATAFLIATSLSSTAASAAGPDKLMVLSVTDVKGKTSPCGCSTPKGGLSRQAAFADSMRKSGAQVIFVDNGGFFPETEGAHDVAGFLMTSMRSIGIAMAGASERELRYGISFLRGEIARTGLPVISSNLMEVKTNRPALEPYRIEKVGKAKVGFFSLLSDRVDLGIARDSLKAAPPTDAATRTVAELRKKGATVVVLLSQLGKIESENIAAAVPGIDAVICGHGVPLVQKGRMIKNAVASYGGEQGQYMSRTILTLDARGKMTAGDNEAVMLGPDVGEKPAIHALVKEFEDARNERLRRAEQKQGAAAGTKTE